jgi:hypothetical protein
MVFISLLVDLKFPLALQPVYEIAARLQLRAAFGKAFN